MAADPMVERVARAIMRADCDDDAQLVAFWGNAKLRQRAINTARAAIGVMLGPTQPMIAAGSDMSILYRRTELGERGDIYLSGGVIDAVWRGMIAAALDANAAEQSRKALDAWHAARSEPLKETA